MSHATRPKPTYMLVCDLCDEEIPEQTGLGEDCSRGNIVAGVSPAPGTVNNRTIHALIAWSRGYGRDPEPEHMKRNYDFHGACIAKLVEDAVAARKAKS